MTQSTDSLFQRVLDLLVADSLMVASDTFLVANDEDRP